MLCQFSVTRVFSKYSTSSWDSTSTSPRIHGEVNVFPNAVYDLKVEILQTHFGESSQFADIRVHGKKVYELGICRPPSTECSTYHRCSLQTKPLVSANGKLHVYIEFSHGVDLRNDICGTNVTARVTFELKGNCSQI